MHRADHATRAQDLHGAGLDGYTEGDPSLGVPATVVTADALNAVQEELASAIEGRGITLDKGNNAQLLEALNSGPVHDLVRPDLAGIRVAILHPHNARAGWDATLGRPEWELSDPGSGGAHVGARSHSSSGRLAFAATAGEALPWMCRVTLVQVLVGQGSSHAEGDRVRVRVSRLGGAATPDVLATVEHPGGTTPMWVSSGSLDVSLHGAISPSSGRYHGIGITVFGGAASPPVHDTCYLVAVHYELEVVS